MPQPCAPSPAGSGVPLPAEAKPPPPVPHVFSSSHACGPTASSNPLRGDHQPPLPSPPSMQPPAPLPAQIPLHRPAVTPGHWLGLTALLSPVPPAGCGCHVPLVPWGPRAGWDKAAAVPLSIMLGGAPAPALLPLSPGASCPEGAHPGSVPLSSSFSSSSSHRGLRQKAGISCWCWAGDTQLRLLPICHPQGHLPLASCSSAERHRDENPPTWQKAWLNAGGWQK